MPWNGHLKPRQAEKYPLFVRTQARGVEQLARAAGQEIVTVELVEQGLSLVSKLFKLFPIPVVIAAHHHPVSIGKLSAY